MSRYMSRASLIATPNIKRAERTLTKPWQGPSYIIISEEEKLLRGVIQSTGLPYQHVGHDKSQNAQ